MLLLCFCTQRDVTGWDKAKGKCLIELLEAAEKVFLSFFLDNIVALPRGDYLFMKLCRFYVHSFPEQH